VGQVEAPARHGPLDVLFAEARLEECGDHLDPEDVGGTEPSRGGGLEDADALEPVDAVLGDVCLRGQLRTGQCFGCRAIHERLNLYAPRQRIEAVTASTSTRPRKRRYTRTSRPLSWLP
jgi:hypothetical protein